MPHSKFGPSGLKSMMSCRARIHVKNDLLEGGEDSGSAFSREGDIAHEVVEHCLVTGEAPESVLEIKVGKTGEVAPTTEDMRLGARLMVDEVATVMAELRDRGENPELLAESRILHSRLPDFGGTIDVLIVSDESVYVLDYKYGAGVFVPERNNSQLMSYVLLALDKYGISKPDGSKKNLRISVVQPRRGLEAVRSWYPAWDVIEEFAMDLENYIFDVIKQEEEYADRDSNEVAVQLLFDGDSEYGQYSPSPDNCRFCKVRPACPAYGLMVGKVQAILDSGEEMDQLDTMASVAKMAKLIKPYVDQCVSECTRLIAEEGVDIPGLDVVPKYGNRKWADCIPEDVALNLNVAAHRISEGSVYQDFTPAKVKASLVKGGYGKEQAEVLIDTVTTREQTGHSLIVVSGEKPVNKILAGFAELSQNQ